MMAGTVIVLNGASSSGKATLARALLYDVEVDTASRSVGDCAHAISVRVAAGKPQAFRRLNGDQTGEAG